MNERAHRILRTLQSADHIRRTLVQQEVVYESIFATHEQAAEVLTDVFEKRWARDRVPRDRTRMESIVPPARAAVEGAAVADLDWAERRVEAAEADAQQLLAKAQAELKAAREKVR